MQTYISILPSTYSTYKQVLIVCKLYFPVHTACYIYRYCCMQTYTSQYIQYVIYTGIVACKPILPSTYSMLYIQVLVACKPILPSTYSMLYILVLLYANLYFLVHTACYIYRYCCMQTYTSQYIQHGIYTGIVTCKPILPSTYSMLYIQVLVACKPILPSTYSAYIQVLVACKPILPSTYSMLYIQVLLYANLYFPVHTACYIYRCQLHANLYFPEHTCVHVLVKQTSLRHIAVCISVHCKGLSQAILQQTYAHTQHKLLVQAQPLTQQAGPEHYPHSNANPLYQEHHTQQLTSSLWTRVYV